jgi:hypothetical protein
MEAEPPVGFCTICLERKPLDQFRRRSRNGELRHHECRDCTNRYLREWRAAKRHKSVDDVLTRLHRYRESPGQLEYLAAVVIAAFHGATGFAVRYHNAFCAAEEAGDHKAMMRYLTGLADFMFAAERAKARRKLAEDKRKLKRERLQREARRQEWD